MALLAGKRPSAASVIAVGALVCAMSGTAFATGSSHQNGNTLIAKHTLSGNRLVNHTVGATQLKPAVWHPMTLENGWTKYAVAYGAPEFTKDDQGFVHFRGAITHVGATSDTFTTLPVGFLPAETYTFLPAASTNGANDPQTVVLVIQNTGEVTAQPGTGATLNFVSLAGVTFATN